MKITLAKALIVKNRLVQELTKLETKIGESNSITMQGVITHQLTPIFKYVIADLFTQRATLTDKLIDTKLAIASANSDKEQQKRIFTLGEMKSSIKILNAMTCEEDRNIQGGYGGAASIVSQTFVQMNEDQRDKMVTEIQLLIDSTQEEMEKFNWQTEIEVPD